ncbi:hypothetical protein EDC05_004534 [Coemansia umbellata]|uniref:Uncharacterized protein n=1 Tax=Coemansia umbellata TaxID=1424467 RepID=A0ABQ8PHZ1_9FUNG|nr:hypothetical protein EDC05_004534 [Coemansia umbellata]
MANARSGTPQGPKRKGGRKAKAQSTINSPNTHTRADSSSTRTDSLPGKHAATDPVATIDASDKQPAAYSTDHDGNARAAAAPIPNAGSSGGQPQMVFTVGTFDDDDDNNSNGDIRDGTNNTSFMVYREQQNQQQQLRSCSMNNKGLHGGSSSSAADVPHASHGPSSGLAHISQEHTTAEPWDSSIDLEPQPDSSAEEQPQSRRQPLFTMGSHSEISDMDDSDGSENPLSIHQKHINGDNDATGEALHSPNSMNKRGSGHPTSTKTRPKHTGNGTSDSASKDARKSDDPNRCASMLHSCKATTSLSQLHTMPVNEQGDFQSTNPAYSNMIPPALVSRERVTSAPPVHDSGDYFGEDDVDSDGLAVGENKAPSEGPQRSRGKTNATREVHLKARKKAGSKKLHTKKAASTVALRTRLRNVGGHRREHLLARPSLHPGGAVNDGQADGSYIDYSGNSSFGDEADHSSDLRILQQQQQPQQPQLNSHQQQFNSSINQGTSNPAPHVPAGMSGPDQSKASLNSSTATLGAGAGQEIDDSATTASIDSPQSELIEDAAATREGNSSINGVQRQRHHPLEAVDSVLSTAIPVAIATDTDAASIRNSTNPTYSQISEYSSSEFPENSNLDRYAPTELASTPQGEETHHEGMAHDDTTQAYYHRKQTRHRDSEPEQHQSQTAYISKGSKRNIESQRQQGIVEKEEEDMEIANSYLTGIPRRCNRPAGMVPHVFLFPDMPAYGQQVRKTERLYASSRAMAHPLLESMARCVELREQRLALSAPRANTRSLMSRRTLAEPTEADLQADWWASLMPPPPLSAPNREQRAALGYASRLQPAELPNWVLPPDDAKCAVYGPEMDPSSIGAQHEQTDPSCPHVRVLRARAKELRVNRQHTVTAGRNNAMVPPRVPASATAAALETWRGRRVPGLLNVDMYTGSVGPLESAGKQGRWLGLDTPFSSSPESTNVHMNRGNQLAPPYRRYGTVYGYTAANQANAWAGNAVNTTAAALASGSGGAQTSLRSASRGHDSISSSRPGTAGVWENDPRRSSYFDRLSVDEVRPQIASSTTTQTTPAGLLRRVISGLTGATAAFGTSQ